MKHLKHLAQILAGFALLLAFAVPATAGVEFQNIPSRGTVPYTDNGDGTFSPQLTTGGATAANQTNVQANPGSDASKAIAVQGVTSGKPISVKIDQTTPGTTNGVQVNAALPAGTAIIGKVGIDQTTPGTTNGVVVTTALPAGTALIGKTGIDQTTDGTTNRVVPPYSQSMIYTGTFTPLTSYSVGQTLGGLITVSTGLGAGVKVRIETAQLAVGAATFTAGATVALSMRIFESSPGSSTYTDGNTAVLAAADYTKVVLFHVPTGSQGSTANGEPTVWVPTANMPHAVATTDGSGNIYVAWVAAGTFTMTTPAAAWRVELKKP